MIFLVCLNRPLKDVTQDQQWNWILSAKENVKMGPEMQCGKIRKATAC